MVDKLETIKTRNNYLAQDLMGPGWLMFFTNTVQVIPSRGGASKSGASARARAAIQTELDIDECDIIDLATLVVLSGLIK